MTIARERDIVTDTNKAEAPMKGSAKTEQEPGRKGKPRQEGKTAEESILLVADSVMELMGFCHFLSSQCLLNRGLCIQKDH